MIRLAKEHKRWEIVVDVGNDYGEPSYLETREYDTKEDVLEALENISYYDSAQSVKEIIEYSIDYVCN